MKNMKSLKLIISTALLSVIFTNSVSAFGTITSGTFDTPPGDDELAENYAVYEVDDKYIVDESPKVAGVNPVVCSRGSKSLFHKVSKDGIPENYLTFLSPTDKYISFTSDDENIATADKTAFYCNNVGRTVIHINTGVHSPARYKYNYDYDIIVYDVKVNGNGLRRQITSTIDRAMSVLANGGEMPKFIDEKTAYMLFDIMTTGKSINANLDVDLITEDNISEEKKSKIAKKIEKDGTIISYYDINIETTEENVDGTGRINELDDEVEVSIDLPLVPEVADGYEREYYVVRVHDDEVEKISASVDNGKVLFNTDRFSIYALAYSDVPSDVGAPNTGESLKEEQSIFPSYTIFAVGGIAIIFCVVKLIRNKRLN